MTYYPTILDYLEDDEHVLAFSTTRKGGVGEGNYAGFNINAYCGDNPAHVKANRKAFCNMFGMKNERLIMPHQVHGTEVRKIDDTYFSMTVEERVNYLEGVDALMTQKKHICIGVSTADCIPVLLVDHLNLAVCVIHAGWRGTAKCIVEKSFKAMQQTYGSKVEDMEAIIGPGISMKNFEVGDEVYDEFAQAGFDMDEISCRIGGKWHIDLWEANRRLLLDQNMEQEKIMVAGICTYDHVDDFFSARRLGVASGRIFTGAILVE